MVRALCICARGMGHRSVALVSHEAVCNGTIPSRPAAGSFRVNPATESGHRAGTSLVGRWVRHWARRERRDASVLRLVTPSSPT